MIVLSAFYDLKVSPATFDIFEFIYQAEIERINNGMDKIDLFIVANDRNNGFREEKASTLAISDLNWRLRNILLTAGELLPSTRRTVHVPNREEAVRFLDQATRIFPQSYSIDSPIASYLPSEMLLAMYEGKKLGTFRAPPAARKAAQTWLDEHAMGLKPIVITIRSSSNHNWRNSYNHEWLKFADWLDKDTYFPVIIKDTERLFASESSPFDAYAQFDIGAVDLHLRLAIYECAYLNMMLSSGPGLPCFMDNATRAIRFKMLTPDDQISNYAGRGFRWGMQWPNTTAFQKSVWEEDRFEILVNEFEAMVSVIEGSEPGEEHPLPNILQTISLFIAGDNFASAEALIRPLIAQEPDNPELIFLLAKAVHGRCRYDEAIFLFQKLDLLIGNNPDVLAGLGKSLLKNNQTKDAIEILQHAIDAGTQDPYAMIDLADAYLTLSMMDEAFHSLKRTSALLGAEDQSRASWQTGKRMIALMSNAGEIEKAKILILNMRGRFGHYTEISSALDAFEKLIRSG